MECRIASLKPLLRAYHFFHIPFHNHFTSLLHQNFTVTVTVTVTIHCHCQKQACFRNFLSIANSVLSHRSLFPFRLSLLFGFLIFVLALLALWTTSVPILHSLNLILGLACLNYLRTLPSVRLSPLLLSQHRRSKAKHRPSTHRRREISAYYSGTRAYQSYQSTAQHITRKKNLNKKQKQKIKISPSDLVIQRSHYTQTQKPQ